MEAPRHIAFSHGLCTWTAYALGLPDVAVLAFGVVGGGAGAANDLDHPSAAASRVLGSGSRSLHSGVVGFSEVVYDATRGPGDPEDRGQHRMATHAIPVLVLLGLPLLLVAPYVAGWVGRLIARQEGASEAVASLWFEAGTVALLVAFCLLLVIDRLGWRVLWPVGLSLTLIHAWGYVLTFLGLVPVGAGRFQVPLTGEHWAGVLAGWGHQMVAFAPWIAVAALVGMLGHCVADFLTEYGLCILAPFYVKHRGTEDEERWVRIQLPKAIAIKTGHFFERTVVGFVLQVHSVLVMPGVWQVVRPLVVALAAGLWHLAAG
jgi:hypothetical protein